MQFLKNCYAYFIYTIIGVLFFIFMPPIWVFCSWQRTYPIAHFFRICWSKVAFIFCFYFLKIEWETPLDKTKNYVVCFNHTSHLDIPVLISVLSPMTLRFMAKAELAKFPVFGKFFRTLDISVDRADADDARKAFQRADEALENGYTIAIAPEGGTSKNPPQLRDFKSGAFRLAIAHQTPILVLTIFDNWRILPSTGVKQGWHISRVKVHTPIETKNLRPEDYNQLAEQVRGMLEGDLKKVFQEKL